MNNDANHRECTESLRMTINIASEYIINFPKCLHCSHSLPVDKKQYFYSHVMAEKSFIYLSKHDGSPE